MTMMIGVERPSAEMVQMTMLIEVAEMVLFERHGVA